MKKFILGIIWAVLFGCVGVVFLQLGGVSFNAKSFLDFILESLGFSFIICGGIFYNMETNDEK
jgi:hypothetical protein